MKKTRTKERLFRTQKCHQKHLKKVKTSWTWIINLVFHLSRCSRKKLTLENNSSFNKKVVSKIGNLELSNSSEFDLAVDKENLTELRWAQIAQSKNQTQLLDYHLSEGFQKLMILVNLTLGRTRILSGITEWTPWIKSRGNQIVEDHTTILKTRIMEKYPTI